MKAAVCYEFGKPLVVEEVQLDAPQAGEVKAKIAACAICHSDVHWIRGEWGMEVPCVAGHEAAGVITEVGPGVTRVKVGDPVVITLIRSCGHCFYCTIGRPYNCEGDFALNSETRLHTLDGKPIVQAVRVGSFAEYVVVDQSQVVKVPDSLPLDQASLLACGVITGLGAVVNTAEVETGSSVVVIGTGGVGLNSIQGAVLSGASKIIAIDLLDQKLEAAKRFGATHIINGRNEDVLAKVLSLTENRGVDYAFVTVGSSRAIVQASNLVRKGGTTVIVGMPSNADANVPLNSHTLTTGRNVMGSNMGSTRPSVDIPHLVELYQQGRLKLDELITKRYTLDQINEAIESMERGEALRNVIVF
ncbi:MAG: Zn-dependent alcohol dehydrogenase [Caldilineaceae bacterium]